MSQVITLCMSGIDLLRVSIFRTQQASEHAWSNGLLAYIQHASSTWCPPSMFLRWECFADSSQPWFFLCHTQDIWMALIYLKKSRFISMLQIGTKRTHGHTSFPTRNLSFALCQPIFRLWLSPGRTFARMGWIHFPEEVLRFIMHPSSFTSGSFQLPSCHWFLEATSISASIGFTYTLTKHSHPCELLTTSHLHDST